MKVRLVLLFCFCFFIGGCSGNPTPKWTASSHRQLESFKEAFLSGAAPRMVDLRFQKVLQELRKGGDMALLQKAWLTRMALQMASHEPLESGDYPALEAALTVPAHQSFYRWLTGEPSVSAASLPSVYQAFWQTCQSGSASKAIQQLAAIEDPLSRLIATAVAARHLPPNERLLMNAVDTAAHEGWQRPLLAWLKKLKQFYKKTGKTAKAEAVGRRISLTDP